MHCDDILIINFEVNKTGKKTILFNYKLLHNGTGIQLESRNKKPDQPHIHK